MSTPVKNILVAVSGSIAAYKSLYLVRTLIQQGYSVKVVMTSSATDFVSKLSFSTLSANDVYSDITSESEWNNHVELGLWAELMIVAPATANTLAKMAHGLADNMLLACYLSAKCPIYFAPAMDRDMWLHPSTQHNITLLQSYGNVMIDPENGFLASGLIGTGRMAEPDTIVQKINEHFIQRQDLLGKKVMITAGPTHEHLDPVRFIGNESSGKMGLSLAKICRQRGAEVQLILGPNKLKIENEDIEVIHVVSAADMYDAAVERFPQSDIAIMAAAVADYSPKVMADQKIKKKDQEFTLNLVKTKDIAAQLGTLKTKKQLLIGFALETENEIKNAQSKLQRKNFDFIVLNSLQDAGAGFGHDTNKIRIIHKDNNIKTFELKSKDLVAQDIVHEIIQLIDKN